MGAAGANRDNAPIKTLETSFVSAVIYINATSAQHADIASQLANELAGMFKAYEIIVVDDECQNTAIDATIEALADHPHSIVRMGHAQGMEAAMNAGIDAAVGDFVFEIDDISAFDMSFIHAAYAKAMEGADVVNAVFETGSSTHGKLFYSVFNRFSKYPTKLASNPYRLTSRRAVNRVRSMSSYPPPYRKASYAASGLRVAEVTVRGRASQKADLGMAMTGLALYTDAFYKIAFWLAALMTMLSLVGVVYVVAVAATGIAVTGWVTTMLVLTVGFTAVFALMAFTLKYLDLLLRITFERQGYLTNGIERIN